LGRADPRDFLRNPGKLSELDDFLQLLREAEDIFSSEPQLLRVESEDAMFLGDTHGDLDSAVEFKRVVESAGGLPILLGDYVDRGPLQVETLVFVLAWKVAQPDSVIVLRGNHESPLTNPYYGFTYALASKYGRESYLKVVEVFSQMPYAVIWNDTVLAVHGGIAKGLEDVEGISKLPKGDVNPDDPVAMQILWNDPDEFVDRFAPSERGPGIYRFGKLAFEEFMERSDLRMLIRAHEFFPEGVRSFFDERLLSVFSCRYYGGRPSAIRLKRDGTWRPLAL